MFVWYHVCAAFSVMWFTRRWYEVNENMRFKWNKKRAAALSVDEWEGENSISKSEAVNGVDVNYCFRIKLINVREKAVTIHEHNLWFMAFGYLYSTVVLLLLIWTGHKNFKFFFFEDNYNKDKPTTITAAKIILSHTDN